MFSEDQGRYIIEIDKNEVEAVKLVGHLKFQNLIDNIGSDNHFVPSNKSYYEFVLQSIKEAIKNQ